MQTARNRLKPGRSTMTRGAALVLVVACAFAAACGPTTGYRARAAAERYPPFSPEEAALFDDTLAPALFSASARPTTLELDPKLVERTQRADAVLAAQIATVSRDAPEAGKPTFYLVVRPVEEPLAGSATPEPLTLPVGPASPSFPLLELGGMNPVGMRLILFFKRYNEAGFVSVHWHAEPDTPEVRRAIEQARVLSELGS